MRKIIVCAAALALPLSAGGCIRTAASVVTAPFKVAGQAADWATTSQDEADRNYGRKMRKKEAREGRERRDWEKRCRRDPENCGRYDGYVAGRDN
ncbi:hypothetical protein F1C10_12345 [Sphingomonas sp. NBWT7]|uniref:hypothetical protein n=1 Tax=Sphingomonas sp. NBWT7 TaxID=2596913 RepID=UPI001624AC09|nr:hypothetical protein [Sphingomonas sp. NBWT7]QNE32646.1 hypothetical protein F1C10_12345 [Sphingomonas sp. NBWT7]